MAKLPLFVPDSMRYSESSYHKMIEEVEDYAILLLNDEGIIQNWNKGVEKIKGYKEEEIVGKNFRVFYTAEDQEAKLPEQLIERARVQGKAIHEGWRVRKNGTVFWGSIVITALHDDQNNVVGFSKVTRDLTERKQSEDKLLHYARQLESQNKELQQFAYVAAHDMKEPLRKIQFYCSSIMEHFEQMPVPKQKLYLQRSLEAAKRMQSLIDDLLAFAQFSETPQAFVPLNLNTVVLDVLKFYIDADALEPVQVSLSPLPTIYGLEMHINQLFHNLLGNAIKYKKEDRPLKIEIAASIVKDKNHHHSGQSGSHFHRITIADNGIGFAPEYGEKIFEMFERLHSRQEYTGTGIGLSICKKIMDNHNGFVRATGIPGEGAVFELYFPAETPVKEIPG